MADVEVIVKIPEEEYELCRKYDWHLGDHKLISYAIANGTPLPKGHGRLIDADEELEGLRKMKVVDKKDKQSVRFAIIEYEYAPTIIDAESEDET